MNIPFNPLQIYEQTQTISGFDLLKEVKFLLWESCHDVALEYSDWPEDQGFGSSDRTYVMKSVLDEMIHRSGLNLETVFNPMLKVVKKK